MYVPIFPFQLLLTFKTSRTLWGIVIIAIGNIMGHDTTKEAFDFYPRSMIFIKARKEALVYAVEFFLISINMIQYIVQVVEIGIIS